MTDCSAGAALDGESGESAYKTEIKFQHFCSTVKELYIYIYYIFSIYREKESIPSSSKCSTLALPISLLLAQSSVLCI